MRALLVWVAILSIPASALAQSRTPSATSGWSGPYRISVNVGAQASTDGTLSQSFSTIQYAEPAPITASIDAKRATLVDVGASYKVRPQFAIAYAFTASMHDTNAAVTAQVPHPFFLNQPRTISGSTPVSGSARAQHISAGYVVPRGSIELMLLGGPSFFSVKQSLVTDVRFRDEYPYDQTNISFTDAPTTVVEQTVVGFHVGADVAFRLSTNVGAGILARFARGSATLDAGSGNSVKFTAGGLQIGGGVRLAF